MNPTTKIQITIALAEIELILFALGKQPLEQVANTFFGIRSQRDEAIKAMADPSNVVPIKQGET